MNTFFIAGVQRSGTTLLSVLLGNHSAIDMDGYAKVFRLINCYQNYEAILPYNLEHSEKEVLRWKIKTDYKGRLADFLDHEHLEAYADYRELVQSSIKQRLELKNKRIWGDKSPNVQHYLTDVLTIIPDAKIVHIVRDGRATAYSNSNRAHKHILRAAQEWVDGNVPALVNQTLVGKRQYLIVKYEELLRNPTLIAKEVCQFLEIDFEPQMVDLSSDGVTAEADRYVKSRFDIAKIDQFRTQIDASTLRKIEEIQAPLLVKLGYELVYEELLNKARPLSVRRQIWYRQLDNIKMLFRDKRIGMVNRQNVEIKISWRNRLSAFVMAFGKDFLPKSLYQLLWQKAYNKGKYFKNRTTS